MGFEPILQEAEFSWTNVALVVIALAVGWTILKAVLKLTLRVFTLGCLGLLALAGGLIAWRYLG